MICDIIYIQEGNGKYCLQVVKESIGVPKIFDIYCDETPSKVTTTLHKIGSICLVGEETNIFPHRNTFIDSLTVYELIKGNIEEILQGT